MSYLYFLLLSDYWGKLVSFRKLLLILELGEDTCRIYLAMLVLHIVCIKWSRYY